MTLRWPRPTVRLRLTLTYTGLFVVTGAALLGASYVLVQHREKGPGTAVQIICSKEVTSGRAGARIGRVVAGSGSGTLTVNPSNCPNVVGGFYYHSSGSSSGSSTGSGGAVAPTSGSQPPVGGPSVEVVQQLTATVKASEAHTLHSFRLDSAVALAIMTIMSFGLSWWMAGRVLRPVHRITDAARTLSEHTLHARIDLQGPDDELKQLADTFDAMLGRLNRAFQSQRRFVANASHELRTPLAVERVLIDEALANPSAGPGDMRSILEHLRTNSEETERLIDALLVLARSERGIEQWASVDLAAIMASVVGQCEAEAAAAGLTVESDLWPVRVRGDPGLIERLAGNLMENAVRHNVPGGSVSLTVGQESGTARLEVVNTGPELDPATVRGLVEPFRRAGPDRSSDDGGAGLGLSIVDAVVSAHGGRLDLAARTGGGLDVRVHLPLSASDPALL